MVSSAVEKLLVSPLLNSKSSNNFCFLLNENSNLMKKVIYYSEILKPLTNFSETEL